MEKELSFEALVTKANTVFNTIFNATAICQAWAPGRINIIGEHTDYNRGLALPAAINRWVVVVGKPRLDSEIIVYSYDFKEKFTFQIDEIPNLDTTWKKYVFGVFKLFSNGKSITKGFEACILGNIPLGSGVSSSAGLTVSLVNFLNQLYHSNVSSEEMIKIAQLTEHEFLGVKCGMLDQYASQFSKEGKVMLLDFAVPSHQYFNADFSGYQWVLVDTKVKRQLASSKYTERVLETKVGFEKVTENFREVKHFRDIQLKHLQVIENEEIRKRLKHYVTENTRVKAVVEALHNKELAKVGDILIQSHNSLKNDYEVSCEELDYLVQEASLLQGCVGARMMGGGFGGCTINLVKSVHIPDFVKTILKIYNKKFNINAEAVIYETVNGAGASNL